MGKKSTPKPPDYTPLVNASREQAAASSRTSAEQLAWAREQDSANREILRQVLDVQLPAMENQAESEQRLEPLRNRIGDLRLKEQEARLTEEQFANQLAEAGADEEALRSQVERGVRSSHLNTEITRLSDEITALGAVNLAALEELNAARERKVYLDTQSADLEQALETLESAIRRIDRETRELLGATFEQVNRHFGEMFPSLFGGGTAKLVLTGKEILDAGIQVIAQPPGNNDFIDPIQINNMRLGPSADAGPDQTVCTDARPAEFTLHGPGQPRPVSQHLHHLERRLR